MTTDEPTHTPTPIGPRPLPYGSHAHEAWLVAATIELAERLGVDPGSASRRALVSARLPIDRAKVKQRDFDRCGGVERIRSLAVGRLVTGPGGGPVDAIPDGYELRSVATVVDADGATRQQSLRVRPVTRRGEVRPSLPEGHRVAGLSTLVDGSGRVVAQWAKTSLERETREQALRRILADVERTVTVRLPPTPPPDGVHDDDLLACYPLGDPHLGLLSWARETGEDFDLGIARRLLVGAMRDLVKRGPRARKALVANLGDFFHSDNPANRTARSGHALDVDGRWAKVLAVGVEVMVELVRAALEHHAEVRVVNAIGNHDDNSAVMLSLVLGAWFRDEPRVQVDASPAARHWLRHGRVLLGITHGHQQGHADLAEIMAAERPEDWGQTVHRHWLTGHIHHQQRLERRGVVIESFRTLAARDAWAAGVGYRAGRDMHRIVYHREWGEISREVASVAYLEAKGRAA